MSRYDDYGYDDYDDYDDEYEEPDYYNSIDTALSIDLEEYYVKYDPTIHDSWIVNDKEDRTDTVVFKIRDIDILIGTHMSKYIVPSNIKNNPKYKLITNIDVRLEMDLSILRFLVTFNLGRTLELSIYKIHFNFDPDNYLNLMTTDSSPLVFGILVNHLTPEMMITMEKVIPNWGHILLGSGKGKDQAIITSNFLRHMYEFEEGLSLYEVAYFYNNFGKLNKSYSSIILAIFEYSYDSFKKGNLKQLSVIEYLIKKNKLHPKNDIFDTHIKDTETYKKYLKFKKLKKYFTLASAAAKLTSRGKKHGLSPRGNQYAEVYGENRELFESQKYTSIKECLDDNILSTEDRKIAEDQGYLKKGSYINPMFSRFRKNQLYFMAKKIGLKVTKSMTKGDICKKIVEHDKK